MIGLKKKLLILDDYSNVWEVIIILINKYLLLKLILINRIRFKKIFYSQKNIAPLLQENNFSKYFLIYILSAYYILI